MANALKEIEHAQRLCDRGDITIGEYFDLVKKWEDAEPIKHAHDLMDKARYFYCSECGYAVADVFEGAYHHDERVRIFEEGRSWNYCPNCGARMDGGEDEQIEQSKGSRL